MDENEVCKKILISRTQSFLEDEDLGKLNAYNSPVFEILNAAKDVGLFDTCIM